MAEAEELAPLPPYSDEVCARCGWFLRQNGDCTRCGAVREAVRPLTRIEKLYLAMRLLGLSGAHETSGTLPLWRRTMLGLYRNMREASAVEIREQLAHDASEWRNRGCPI